MRALSLVSATVLSLSLAAVAGAQPAGFVLITETPAGSATATATARHFTVFHGRALEPSAATTIGFGRLAVVTSSNTWAGPQSQSPGGHIEWQWRLLEQRRVSLTIGSGVRRERDGAEFLIARATAATSLGASRLVGHVTMEQSRSAGRDRLDLVTAAGWTRPVSRTLRVGAEAIGEDLEGLWDPHEADGGARLFAGPSVEFHASQRTVGRVTAGTDLRGSGAGSMSTPGQMRVGLAMRATVTVGF